MSSIIIKGMKMPRTCAECEWSRYSYPNAVCVMAHITINIEIAKNGRPNDCPIIPFPEKHGKIIDADKLWENMTVEQSKAFQKGLASDIELFEILEAAEAIVPEEDKKG